MLVANQHLQFSLASSVRSSLYLLGVILPCPSSRQLCAVGAVADYTSFEHADPCSSWDGSQPVWTERLNTVPEPRESHFYNLNIVLFVVEIRHQMSFQVFAQASGLEFLHPHHFLVLYSGRGCMGSIRQCRYSHDC